MWAKNVKNICTAGVGVLRSAFVLRRRLRPQGTGTDCKDTNRDWPKAEAGTE